MEFNALHKDKDWDEDDYLSLAGVFIDQKISQYQSHSICLVHIAGNTA